MGDLGARRDLLASISQEWDKAEADIKRAEQVCSSIVLPSIKELRYAGRRVIDGLNKILAGEPAEVVDDLFRDARFDCHRARHDAIDAATAKISIDVEIMTRKLGYDVVLRVFPQFPTFVKELKIVREKIAASRGNRGNREQIYSVLEETDFVELVKFYEGIKASEEIMKNMARRERRMHALSYSLGAAGLIVATVALLVDLF